MKVRSLVVLLVAVVGFSCSPVKRLPDLESQADTAIKQSHYEQAYEYLQQYVAISKTTNVKPNESLYLKLAEVCNQLNKVDEASSCYENLLLNANNEGLIQDYTTLLARNHEIKKELGVWSRYYTQIHDNSLLKQAYDRQLILLTESQDYAAAEALWMDLPEGMEVSPEAYFSVVQSADQLGHSKNALKACNWLLKLEPDHIGALEWKAKYLYESAEKSYNAEMAKYNKNKNATTYAYLRRDLKVISGDFRESRDLFLKLRKISPEEESYLKYLKNIYIRLDMKQEAAKIDKLLN